MVIWYILMADNAKLRVEKVSAYALPYVDEWYGPYPDSLTAAVYAAAAEDAFLTIMRKLKRRKAG